MFKYCEDQIIRKCVPEEKQQGILSHCHDSACGGHFVSQKTVMKVCSLVSTDLPYLKKHTKCAEYAIDAKGSKNCLAVI